MLQAIDYYMKSIYIFNLKFPEPLREFLNYIMINVYNLKDKEHAGELKLATTAAEEFFANLQLIKDEYWDTDPENNQMFFRYWFFLYF